MSGAAHATPGKAYRYVLQDNQSGSIKAHHPQQVWGRSAYRFGEVFGYKPFGYLNEKATPKLPKIGKTNTSTVSDQTPIHVQLPKPTKRTRNTTGDENGFTKSEVDPSDFYKATDLKDNKPTRKGTRFKAPKMASELVDNAYRQRVLGLEAEKTELLASYESLYKENKRLWEKLKSVTGTDLHIESYRQVIADRDVLREAEATYRERMLKLEKENMEAVQTYVSVKEENNHLRQEIEKLKGKAKASYEKTKQMKHLTRAVTNLEETVGNVVSGRVSEVFDKSTNKKMSSENTKECRTSNSQKINLRKQGFAGKGRVYPDVGQDTDSDCQTMEKGSTSPRRETNQKRKTVQVKSNGYKMHAEILDEENSKLTKVYETLHNGIQSLREKLFSVGIKTENSEYMKRVDYNKDVLRNAERAYIERINTLQKENDDMEKNLQAVVAENSFLKMSHSEGIVTPQPSKRKRELAQYLKSNRELHSKLEMAQREKELAMKANAESLMEKRTLKAKLSELQVKLENAKTELDYMKKIDYR